MPVLVFYIIIQDAGDITPKVLTIRKLNDINLI